MQSLTVSKNRTESKVVADAIQKHADVRKRELTPTQQRAVMMAQQQILRARRNQMLKTEREARLNQLRSHDDMLNNSIAADVFVDVEHEDVAHHVTLREAIGYVLRDIRTSERKTLREVSEKAGVSLGYLSEVERGQKEASSDLLMAIAHALGLTTANMLRRVANYLDANNM